MERTFFQWIVYIAENYGMQFLKGAGVTMLIAISGTVVGWMIGLLIGIVKTIPRSVAQSPKSLRNGLLNIANILLNCYIEVFRGTPMIVQAVIIYYGLMEGFGLDLPAIPAGILIVSINTGAYMAEVVRGGIESIDSGQTEAAKAIGMTHFQTMINVILPQAIRNILPATGNEFIINIKDTSVLNVIMVSELFLTAKTIKGMIYRTYEPFLMAAAIYLVLTLATTQILKYFERRMDGPKNFSLMTSSTMPTQIRQPRGRIK